MIRLHIHYFASLAEQLECDEEHLELDSKTLTVSELKATLSVRGEAWDKALRDPSTRCAVNHSLANDDLSITENTEIAFFPPVTGG